MPGTGSGTWRLRRHVIYRWALDKIGLGTPATAVQASAHRYAVPQGWAAQRVDADVRWPTAGMTGGHWAIHCLVGPPTLKGRTHVLLQVQISRVSTAVPDSDDQHALVIDSVDQSVGREHQLSVSMVCVHDLELLPRPGVLRELGQQRLQLINQPPESDTIPSPYVGLHIPEVIPGGLGPLDPTRHLSR